MNGNKMTKREEGRKDGRRREGIQDAAQGIEGEKRIERERPGGRDQQGSRKATTFLQLSQSASARTQTQTDAE